MKMKWLLLIIPIIILTSYIFSYYWRKYSENFANQEEVVNDWLSSNMYISNSNYVSSNQDPNLQNTLDSSGLYNNILLSEDIIIDPNSSNTGYEILDTIVPDSNALLRAIQFENSEARFIPQHSNVDLRQIYNSNFYAMTMQEQSLQMNLDQLLYNNHISIEDPISDAYLPYSCNVYDNIIKTPEQNNFEYSIISLFKELLDRNPTASEIEKYSQQFTDNQLDINMLRVNLLNSSEYRRNMKLQNNDVSADIEYSHAKEDMLSYLNKLYFMELDKESPKAMLLPLKDVYIYLQNNEYLFRALLVHRNYHLFEKDVLDTKMLTKAKLSDLFNNYFIPYDLQLSGNDIMRHDYLNKINTNQSETPQSAQLQPSDPSVVGAPIDVASQDQDTSGHYDMINSEADKIFDINDIRHFRNQRNN